jgi:8-oxo-dGTP diphosphatase
MVTTDVLLFSGVGQERKILLIKRGRPPDKGKWALPGGFIEMDEDLIDSAKRELAEETGITGVELQELFTVGTPGRDPRGRVITVMFFAIVDMNHIECKAGDDAAEISWFSVSDLPQLAFDHEMVIRKSLVKLSSDTNHS